VALFFTGVHARMFRRALSEFIPHSPPANSELRHAFEKLEAEINHRLEEDKICA
jgi:hypothetical protein